MEGLLSSHGAAGGVDCDLDCVVTLGDDGFGLGAAGSGADVGTAGDGFGWGVGLVVDSAAGLSTGLIFAAEVGVAVAVAIALLAGAATVIVVVVVVVVVSVSVFVIVAVSVLVTVSVVTVQSGAVTIDVVVLSGNDTVAVWVTSVIGTNDEQNADAFNATRTAEAAAMSSRFSSSAASPTGEVAESRRRLATKKDPRKRILL